MNKHKTRSKDHKIKTIVSYSFQLRGCSSLLWNCRTCLDPLLPHWLHTGGLSWLFFPPLASSPGTPQGCVFSPGMNISDPACPSYPVQNSSPELVALQWASGSSGSSCASNHLGKSYSERARTRQIHKLYGNLGPCSSSSIIAFPDMFYPMVTIACRQRVRFLVVRCGAFDFTENNGAQWRRVPKGAKMFLTWGNITTYESQDQH